jgi:colanic acid/amylovoran biosynthesis glycosyltransferase
MLRVAYLANRFPSPVEPYVSEEIEELRRRGLKVVAGSALKPDQIGSIVAVAPNSSSDVMVLQPFRMGLMMRSFWLCLRRWRWIADLFHRIVLQGHESPLRRVKALLHTWLGAYYALRLRDQRIEHIHVHHGYFGSWLAMVAARLLNIGFSMTLHGSDLLLHGAYLDTKLKNCRFCLTVSEFNRRYILEHYPKVDAEKILVSRLGVDVPNIFPELNKRTKADKSHGGFSILTVGRLHAVKDQAFLVRACDQLRARNIRFDCSIAGEGPERRTLESLIRRYGLEPQVTLLGHVPKKQMDSLYARSDVVVLTSRSEGIPLVLMEAMARGKLVLAPAITGIPELIVAGKSGFLYEPGSLEDLVGQLLFIYSLMPAHGSPDLPCILSSANQLDRVRHAALVQVRHNYNRPRNLRLFGDLFIQRTTAGSIHEDSVLQQI